MKPHPKCPSGVLRALATPVCALLLAAVPAAAQPARVPTGQNSGASLVFAAGLAFPLDDFTDMVLNGWQASLRAEYRVAPPLAAYLGARYANFQLRSPDADDNLAMIAPEVGLVFRPRAWSPLTPSFRAGAFLPQFSSGGENSGAGIGISTGAGLELAVGDQFTLAAVGTGDFNTGRLKAGPFGPIPPKPGWLGVTVEGRFGFR
ncbi:MAG TPA: hypothetical protein VJT67_09060 [Longimicrobiaceae bacterium]|nr:hypothetical protein [Longimicrobiaceae bacterium]